jgi:BirA family biotin operon repressor/biotin-[acetyl-CoA-carboxylase] ligase
MKISLKEFETLPNISAPIKCYFFEQIPSTNNQVWELHKLGEKFPFVVIAGEQTAGKGQRGNQWKSSQGGLYLSLGLELDLPVNLIHQITLFSVWGIANSLRQYQIDVKIKWLNDLILEQKKLGGILTETRIYQNRVKQVVIGVGINWNNPVPEGGINLKSVWDKQGNSQLDSLENLADLTIKGILHGYEYYLREGSENLANEYEKLLINIGQKITFQGGEGVITGVNPNGDLKVRLYSTGSSTEICLPPGSISLGYYWD